MSGALGMATPASVAEKPLAARASGGWVPLVWNLGAFVVIIVLTVVSAWPVYGSARLVLVVGVGTVIGAGSVLLGRMLHLRWWWQAGIVVLLYLVTVAPVAVPSAWGSPGRFIRGVFDGVLGVVLGWKQLLTVSLPAADYQAVLVPAFVVAIVGSLAAAAVMIYGGRLAAFAVVPLLAMPLFGALFGAAETGPQWVWGPVSVPAPMHVLVAVAAVAVCLIWLVGRARIARAQALRVARGSASTVQQGGASLLGMLRRQVMAAVLVLVALAAGLLAAPVAGALGPREVLRDGVDPLLVLARQPSPLSAYRAWFAGDRYATELFRVDAPQDIDRLRIATLDDYDGQSFRVSAADSVAGPAHFTRVPRTVGSEASATITVGPGYSGVWVPLAVAGDRAPEFVGSRAEQLAAGYYADSALNAAIVVTDDEGTGLLPGDSYRIPVDASASDAAFAAATGGEPKLDEERFPALAAWVELQDVGRTGADVIELVERLVDRGYLSHALRDGAEASEWIAALRARAGYEFAASRSGHAAARIDELFESLIEQQHRAGVAAPEAMLVAGLGDDEQFATASALVARYLGFESRVVLGVRLGETGSELGVEPCAEVCTGANVTAWAEARTPSGAWAVLDATPQFKLSPQVIAPSEIPPENPTAPRVPAADVLDPPAAKSEDSAASQSDDVVDDNGSTSLLPVIRTVLLALAGVVLLVLPVLVFPIMKVARRGWRRRAPAEVAMVGAWYELVDHYVDYRVEVPERLTRTEMAEVMQNPAALELAELVDRAVFSEQPPGTVERDAGWHLFEQERRRLAAEATFWKRVRAVLSPVSLLRREPEARPHVLSPSATTTESQRQ